jgi:hypothetical protein
MKKFLLYLTLVLPLLLCFTIFSGPRVVVYQIMPSEKLMKIKNHIIEDQISREILNFNSNYFYKIIDFHCYLLNQGKLENVLELIYQKEKINVLDLRKSVDNPNNYFSKNWEYSFVRKSKGSRVILKDVIFLSNDSLYIGVVKQLNKEK